MEKIYGIRFMSVTGEEMSADVEAAEEFVKSFPEIVLGLSP